MSVVQIALTAEQLASAYAQLTDKERRSFLVAVFDQPTNQRIAVELLVEAQRVLKRKLPAEKQRRLDRLLTKNAEGILRSSEREELNELISEYQQGLVEKARAKHLLELARHAAFARN